MSTPVFVFCLSQFDELAERYVDSGSALLKAERQRDVDGARVLLLDDAFKKFRQDPKPSPAPPATVLDARGVTTTGRLTVGKTSPT